MSSFIGHSLAGLTASVVPKQRRWQRSQLLWSGYLVVLACAPDLDYFIPILHPNARDGVRLTHCILFSLLLSLGTIAVLKLKGSRWRSLQIGSLQAIAASLSHLVLDLFVGVSGLPLLFPWSQTAYKLPFGLLPSAGKLDISNYYFYRNLFIELGVLIPIFAIIFIVTRRERYSDWKYRMLPILAAISVIFMVCSARLSR